MRRLGRRIAKVFWFVVGLLIVALGLWVTAAWVAVNNGMPIPGTGR